MIDGFEKLLPFLSKKDRRDLELLRAFSATEDNKKNLDINLLNSFQQQVYEASKSKIFKICDGAIRSGKTYYAVFEFIEAVLRMDQNHIGILTSSSLPALRRNVFDYLEDFCKHDNIQCDLSIRADSSIRIDNKKIYCFGMNDVRSMKRIRGFSASIWYGNEVTEYVEGSIEITLGRLDKGERFKIWDCNPKEPTHNIYENYIQKIKSDMFRQHWRLEDNPTLSKDYVEDMKSAFLGTVVGDRDILGLWVSSEGQPFANIRLTKIQSFRNGICFVDPSFGGSKNSGLGSSTAVSFVNEVDGYYYVYGKKFNDMWYKCVPDIIMLAKDFNVFQILVEGNITHGGAVQEFSRYGYEDVLELGNSKNKYERIMSISHLVHTGDILLHELSDPEYIKEVKVFSKNSISNDCPDSMESAIRYLRSGTSNFSKINV